MAFLYSFSQCSNTLLQLFLVVLPLLANKKLVQLESSSSIAKCVIFYASKKLWSESVLVAHFEEVLNSVEAFVVIEHVEVLVLLLLWHVSEAVKRIICSEFSKRSSLNNP